jgi:hypothetical protein
MPHLILTKDFSSQEAPNCFRYARTSALGATDTYYSYACGTASADIFVLATATNGAAQTEAADPTGAGDTSLFTIPGLGPTGTGTGTGTGSTSNSPTAGNSSKSPLSTTAIALIAVAGIMVISIALFLGYWYGWRKRHENHDLVHRQDTRPAQLDYQETVTAGPAASIHSWGNSIPPGANPNIAPSEAGTDLSGGTATETRRLMATVPEQSHGYGQRYY